MTEEYVLRDAGNRLTHNFKPNCSITFHRGNDKVGALDFNGPEMTFSGDMDESAKLFLEVVANAFKTRLEQERAVGYREGHRAALIQRTWVGLTNEDIKPFCDANHIIFGAYTLDFVKAIETKLKEKNT